MDPDRRAALRVGGLVLAGAPGCFQAEVPRGVPDGRPIEARAGQILLPWSALPVDRQWYEVSREAGDGVGRAAFVTYGETAPATPRSEDTAREHGEHYLDHRVRLFDGEAAAADAFREWAASVEQDETSRDTRPDVGDEAVATEPPEGGDYRLRFRENNLVARFEDATSEPDAPAVVLEAARAHLDHIESVAGATPRS